MYVDGTGGKGEGGGFEENETRLRAAKLWRENRVRSGEKALVCLSLAVVCRGGEGGDPLDAC